MGDLIERLEAATAGSRELDAELWDLIDPRPRHDLDGTGAIWKRDPDDGVAFDGPPAYTTSLDAALALAERVLPRWGFDVGSPARMGEPGGRPWADCWPPVEDGEVVAFKMGGPRPTHRHSNAATVPLALCIAILRAITEDKSCPL